MKKTIKNIALLTLSAALWSAQPLNAQFWRTTGNAGITSSQYLGTTDDTTLKIRTVNVERMRINGNVAGKVGYVGIGTTAPSTRLHVNGVVTATGGTSTNWNTCFTRIGGAFTTNYVPKWNGTKFVSGVLYDNGTSIGIGNTAPSANLHITPNSNIFAFRIDQGVNGQGALVYVNTTSNAKTVFAAASNATGLYVLGDGHVAVGAGSAPSRLTIADGSQSSAVPIVDVTNNNTGVNVDVRGIRSSCIMNPGYGYGIEAFGGYKGVAGTANASTYGGNAYGVIGAADGSAGTRYGVYGTATNSGGEAWGGYFPTKTYTNELRVGGTQGATGYVAAINGKLIATEVRVALTSAWPDYVFSSEHKLMPLEELDASINSNKHLPGIPTACEVEDNGIMLGEMQTKTLEKIEELTLYLIQLKKENNELRSRIETLEKK